MKMKLLRLFSNKERSKSHKRGATRRGAKTTKENVTSENESEGGESCEMKKDTWGHGDQLTLFFFF
jgi:hypothetical protein